MSNKKLKKENPMVLARSRERGVERGVWIPPSGIEMYLQLFVAAEVYFI